MSSEFGLGSLVCLLSGGGQLLHDMFDGWLLYELGWHFVHSFSLRGWLFCICGLEVAKCPGMRVNEGCRGMPRDARILEW